MSRNNVPQVQVTVAVGVCERFPPLKCTTAGLLSDFHRTASPGPRTCHHNHSYHLLNAWNQQGPGLGAVEISSLILPNDPL